MSLIEVLRVYLVVRFQIKIVNLCIGRKNFANLLTCTSENGLYKWASNDAAASLLYADMFEIYFVVRFYTNVMIPHRRLYASLLASRLRASSHVIAVPSTA